MKVLLVRPGAPNKLSFTNILYSEPLELEYLHTGLMNAGIEDEICDYLVQSEPYLRVLKRYQPQVVAVTGYITQEKIMKRLCEQTKKCNPEIVTIVGGVHAQLNTHVFFQEYIDYITRSESVDAFVEVVRYIQVQKENEIFSDIDDRKIKKSIFNPVDLDGVEIKCMKIKDNSHKHLCDIKLENINGLCYKKEGEWVKNRLIPIDINTLPIPNRSFYEKNKEHFRYLDLKEAAAIKTSFSCPYNCNFCYCTLLNHGKYQERNLDMVIEELKNLSATNVVIVDDDFLVNEKRLWEFVRLVKEHKIQKRYG